MANPGDEDIYWNQVETFINQANEACDLADPGIVAAALLNAAARFNAFVIAHSSLDKNEFSEDVEGTTTYLTGRFREHLKEHMEDYRENYTALIGPRESAPE
jgi:hypothetical protein